MRQSGLQFSTPTACKAPPFGLIITTIAFGFFSGLPLPLSGFTLRQWLTESNVSLAIIGLTANIGLAYSLKFLWAPLLDRWPPPFGLRRFGQRRGWLLCVQVLLCAACGLLAMLDPATDAWAVLAVAAGIAILSATQDVGIDAWRIGSFTPAEQGLALAAYVWGYRLALLAAKSGVIALATPWGWQGALAAMAVLSMAAPCLTCVASEPAASAPPAIANGFAAPFRDLLCRPATPAILAFVLLFKLGEALAGTMAPSFYHALGFDRGQIAAAMSLPNLIASLLGISIGGLLVARLGPGRALIATGFVQMASMGLYFALAVSAGDARILVAKIVLEAFAEAMADAAFLGYLSGLCRAQYAAAQYALLSSIAALGLHTLAGVSGVLAHSLGWVRFYGLTMLASLPAMAIMLWLLRRPHREVGSHPPECPDPVTTDAP